MTYNGSFQAADEQWSFQAVARRSGKAHYVILAFISSRISSSPLPTDLTISATDPDFAATGLHASSKLRLHRLMTVTTSIIKRELGQLPKRTQLLAKQKLTTLFGLD
jgi:mRNA interferase MazF